jgi:hypothetical protein
MAVRERGCANCGAINYVGSDACWRCLESLNEEPTAAQTPVTTAAERRPP